MGRGISDIGRTIVNPIGAINPLDPNFSGNIAGGKPGKRQPGGMDLVSSIGPISDEFRRQRESDLARGRARGEEMFGDEALGRVREQRTQDIGDAIGARRRQFEQGLEAPEFQAARETGLRGLRRQEQGAMRQLRGAQGATGVGGPLAAAQRGELLRAQDVQRRDAEQRLLLQDVGLRRQALGGFEQAVQAAERDEFARQKYNQEQLRRELLGIQTRELAEAGLGVAERGAAGTIAAGAMGQGKKGGMGQGGLIGKTGQRLGKG